MVQDTIVIRMFEEKMWKNISLGTSFTGAKLLYHVKLEHGWKISENKVLGGTLVYRESQGQEDGENCVVISITILYVSPNITRIKKKKIMR